MKERFWSCEIFHLIRHGVGVITGAWGFTTFFFLFRIYDARHDGWHTKRWISSKFPVIAIIVVLK
jgi:hypothetical protein